MTDEPPPAFQEKERKHGSERRELRADDPFWDLAPETVEWRTYRGSGSRYDVTRSREEYLEFAWPDGRTELVGDKPYIIMFTQYDSVTPDGRSQATRDTNFHADDHPVRELYATCFTPPRWIGLFREDLFHHQDDDPDVDETFQSYVVVEPPAPRGQPAQAPKTMGRVNGSLEGTGWIKAPPGAVTTEQGGGGLLRRLRGFMSG